MTLLEIQVEDAKPVAAHCDATDLHVVLADGRRLSAPLWWYPRLLGASIAERNVITLMRMGLHWPDIDDDVSITSILQGRRAPGARQPEKAA